MFVVNVALDAIGVQMGRVPLNILAWVLNAYAILCGALLIPAGGIADVIGRRRTFILGLVTFSVGSAACGLSTEIGTLIAARCVQAVGAALITPSSLGLIVAVFPAEERPRAIRLWAASGALAGAAGPVIGGLFAAYAWQLIFLINLPLGAVAIAIALKHIPQPSAPSSATKVDWLGSALLIFAAGGLALGLNSLDANSSAASTVVIWCVALAATSISIWRVLRRTDTIVPRSLLEIRQFSGALRVLFGLSIGFGILLLGVALYLQRVEHEGMIAVGLLIAPGPCVVGLVSVLSKRADIVTMRRRITAGALILCFTSFGLAAVAQVHASIVAFTCIWTLAGLGVGLTFPNLFAVGISGLPPSQASTGSGVLSVSRFFGATLGTSVLVMALALPAASFAFAFLIAGTLAFVTVFLV